jgi:maleylacetate reductase
MSPSLRETERGARIERRSENVLPRATIYDPELVAHLPPSIAGPSAMNAMANAFGALCAPNASPMNALAALEAMRAISAALPSFLANSADDAAWSDALYGAWLAGVGVCAENVHSRLCRALIDSFGLVHAEVNCLMLPYTAAYQRDAWPGAMRKAAFALQTQDAPEALYDLMRLAATRKSLGQMGVTTNELETVCDLMQTTSGDPASASGADVFGMLMAAYEGRRP